MDRKKIAQKFYMLTPLFMFFFSTPVFAEKIISVQFLINSPTSGIQEALNALPPDGGVLRIPPGVYLLKQSIMIPRNVKIIGSGSLSILKKCNGFKTKLVEPSKKGDKVTTLSRTDGFQPGMQICITSQNKEGWFCSQPVITKIQDNLVYLSEPLEQDYDDKTSVVINYFPALWIEKQNNILIQDILVEGNIQNNEQNFSEFVCAAIHSVRSDNITIRNCIVVDWPSDGFSIQGGKNIIVSECRALNCKGPGFHAGTGLSNSIFNNLTGMNNTNDGFYFCANVHNVIVAQSIFSRNGSNGIGGIGGGRSADHSCIVSKNICILNGKSGISAIEASGFVIAENICRNNSKGNFSRGMNSGILVKDSVNMLVTNNLCIDDQNDGAKSQKFGIEEAGISDNNVYSGNILRGNIKGGITIVGKTTKKISNIE